MGFRIVLVGAIESVIAKRLRTVIEDLPWNIQLCGLDFTAESESSVESFFVQKTPSVVVHLMTEPGDHTPESSLKNITAVCAKLDIPVVQQSCYWAINPADLRAEVLESESAESSLDASEFARFEAMVSSVSKHIILRSSWILDGEGSGLFANLLPPLLAGKASDIVVSDHDFGAPITSAHISETIIALIQQILTGADNWGVYHLRSADACSEAEFCDHLVRQLQKELSVDLNFPNVAAIDDDRRFLSMNANLAGRKITDDFGIQAPTWRRGFARSLKAWLKAHCRDLGLERFRSEGEEIEGQSN